MLSSGRQSPFLPSHRRRITDCPLAFSGCDRDTVASGGRGVAVQLATAEVGARVRWFEGARDEGFWEGTRGQPSATSREECLWGKHGESPRRPRGRSDGYPHFVRIESSERLCRFTSFTDRDVASPFHSARAWLVRAGWRALANHRAIARGFADSARGARSAGEGGAVAANVVSETALHANGERSDP